MRFRKGTPRKWAGVGRGAIALALIFAVVGCGPRASDDRGSVATMTPVVLRYADYTSAKAGDGFRAFAAEVEDATEGTITFREYWGGSLLAGQDMASGIRGGVADLGMFTAVYYPSEFPFTDWLSGLSNLASDEYPLGVLQAAAAQADFAANSPEIQQVFEQRGMKLLYSTHPISSYNILCKSSVTSLADAAGKRIRTGGGVWDAEARALGMVPVGISIGETYEALERGIIDCVLASAKTLTAYGLWEVAKEYTRLPLTGINGQYAVMSLRVWDGLPRDAQRIIWDAAYAWFEGYLKYEGLGLQELLVTEGTRDHGLLFQDPEPDLLEAVLAHQQRARAALPATAPLGLDDPEAVIAQYSATMEKWEGLVRSMTIPEAFEPNAEGVKLRSFDLSEFKAVVRDEVFDRHRP